MLILLLFYTRSFTEILVKFYNEAKIKKLPIEIIFVSADVTEKRMFEYMKETDMMWSAVAFDDPLREQLQDVYNVLAVPTLVIVDQGMNMLTKEAHFDVVKEGLAAFHLWINLSKKLPNK
jgi:hypothetical protein